MSTQVGLGTNVRTNLNLGKMADSDIGNQALGVGFCRQTFILKTLALAWLFLHEKMTFGKGRTTCTYPRQCSEGEFLVI